MTKKSDKSMNGEFLQPIGIPFNIEAMAGMNQKFYKMMMSCNEEIMNFGRNRLKEDLDMPQKLAECKSPQEMMGVCLGFYQTAFKQYTDEAGEITRIYRDMAAEAPEIFKSMPE
ncbi:phasin family protein [Sneathiella sp. HT1-7]|jgi:hypothetical protein|uniref:phasin family protein n=1 Tax=Sneathiella sp. HT1-7 TaxID=2887192 RepID=UPI001D13CE9A|nr:phasin family protein [Sneathiella sp. HT1-7]MCC3305671.1 phasin family protein [Sneathiella sp. HT1-7]